MADIFLSYSRATHRSARKLAERLRASGFTVWFDEHLPAHRSYSEVIEEQLEAAKAVIVLWSEEAVRSQWVRSEANRARETGRLVQVRLDDARLPMPFDQIQCADLRGWTGNRNAQSWQVVESSVAALIGGDRPAAPTSAPEGGTSRRNMLIGGGVTAALALGGVAFWQRRREPEMTPEARLILEKGVDALQQNDALESELPPGSGAQAVALLTQATEILPESPRAWGALAMAYAVRKKSAPLAEREGFAERCREAANRALQLERNELRAIAALRMLDTVYRNWGRAERSARKALALYPTFPIHSFLLSDVLGSVGRWREAAEVSIKADRTRFLIPGADRKVIVNLWAAGRPGEADKALTQAVERWPEHPQVWRTRIAYRMFGGRPAEALALLDSVERPAAIPAGWIDAARATARALTGAGDPSAAVDANLAYVRAARTAVLPTSQALVMVGRADTALAMLNGYYFDEGEWASLAPPGGDEDRQTSPLFQPPMRNLWTDPRFDALLDRIGLNEYWRRSRTVPDFRKAV